MTIWEQLSDLVKAPQRAGEETLKKSPKLQKVIDLASRVAETPGAEMVVPPLAMTKSAFIKGISSMQGVKGLEAAVRAAQKVPRKVTQAIGRVGTFKDIGREDPGSIATTWGASLASPKFIKLIEDVNKLIEDVNKLMPALPPIKRLYPEIGFSERITPSTVGHEAGHILWNKVDEALQQMVKRVYQKTPEKQVLDLSRKTADLSTSEEMFSEAYGHYLAEKSPFFKEFPPAIRHLVKKSHKRMR